MRHALALAAIALCTVAGCSGTTNGRAAPDEHASQPAAPTPSSEAEQVPGPGVPKVTNPLDAAHFQQNPCESLTSAQITEFLGDNPRVKPEPHGPGGPACGWFSEAQLVILFPEVNGLGLTSLYRAKDRVYPFFLPLAPVEGYPVVAYGEEDHRASRGECDVSMGISDRQTVVVSVTQSAAHKGEKDPCESARGVEEKVLGNLRGGR